MKTLFLVAVVLLVGYGLVEGKSSSPAPSTTPLPPTTTTENLEKACGEHNNDCGECVKNPKCLFCQQGKDNAGTCMPYPKKEIIPKSDVCDLSDARWGVCWLNYKALLISMGVLGGVIVIALTTCICCCCCCRKRSNRARYAQEEAQLEREREDRRSKHSERRAERQARMDEIRNKYGLNRDGGNNYRRFDNEA